MTARDDSYRIFFPSSEHSSSTAEHRRAVPVVEDRVRLDELGRDDLAGVGQHLHREVRLAVGEAARHRRARARRVVGSMPSMSKQTWMPGGAVALARLIASSITARMPRSSISRMVKTSIPEALMFRARRRRRRGPTEHGPRASTLGGSRRGARGRVAQAQHDRQRHAVDVARGLRLGRVHVAVGVEPDEAHASRFAAQVESRGRRSSRWRPSGRRRGQRAAAVSSACSTRSPASSQVSRIALYLSFESPGPCVSGSLTRTSPKSSTSWPSSRRCAPRLGDAQGGRAHVDAAAAGAQVHGGADEGHASLRHVSLFPRRGSRRP